MAAPSSDFVKFWCRIDGAEFDAILPDLIASGVALASHETGVDYSASEMPQGVKIWVAAHVAIWIKSPEAAKDADPAPHLSHLLDPHRLYP